jgi:hypothetical protein
MAYAVFDRRDGACVAKVDCLYDCNAEFELGFAEPKDGDWHSLDDNVSVIMNQLGYDVREC